MRHFRPNRLRARVGHEAPCSIRPKTPPRVAGFTLIELSIVLFVVAIISGIAIPRLRDLTSMELSATTRRIANTTRFLSEESAFRSQIYALNIDLENQAYWVTRFDDQTGEFVEDDSLLSRRIELPPDVRIADIVLASAGKLSEGVAPTYFYPEGYADATVIHLVDHRNGAYTVRIDPVRGLGEVHEGYKDFEILETNGAL